MRTFDRIKRIFEALLRRSRLDAELDEELRFHLDRQIAWLVEQGMDPEAARTEALRRFGGVEKVKEECRDERRVNLVDGLLQDISYAARTLSKTKGFAALTVLTLALGIGANTAIFSVVNGVLLAPLPYPDGDDLALLEITVPPRIEGPSEASIAEFYELEAASDSLDLVEYHGMNFTLLGHGYASNVATGVVSHDFFDVLGVRARLGRTFVAADEADGAEAVLVLSDRYWRDEFEADPDVVGRVFEMNDRPHRVIGVLPPLPQYPRYNDVYMPTSACPFRAEGERQFRQAADRDAFRNLRLFGRLQPGHDLGRAGHEIAQVARQMVAENQSYYAGTGYGIETRGLQAVLTDQARPMLLLLLGIVGLVLLVACANAANLMVARVMRRDRELALRSAMGAGRSRLLRQLLTESTLLSLAGGLLGLVLAAATLDLLVDFTARFTSRTHDIQIDAQVLGFTLLVSIVTGMAFGVLPALWHRGDALLTLRESSSPHSTAGRRTLRLRGALIVAQVTLSFVLLIGAGLLTRSLVKLAGVDDGFGEESVLTANVYPNWSAYESLDERVDMFTRVLAAVEKGPGVVSAAVSNTIPFSGMRLVRRQLRVDRRPPGVDQAAPPNLDGHPEGLDSGNWMVELASIGISADYLATLGLDVVEGRALRAAELDARAPVVMISAAAARRYWGDDSPLGYRIAAPEIETEQWAWYTIVGVVEDARHEGLDREAPMVLYGSYRLFSGAGQLLVRTTADEQTMGAFIQQAMARVAPEQAVFGFETTERLRSASMAVPRLITLLMGLFAGLALLITVAGIGGVVAYSVGQRRREIGLRMALGAERRAVLTMVVRQGLWMVLAGLFLGATASLWLGGIVASWLFEVRPTDPVTFAGVALVLFIAGVVACLAPARRATAIDPVVALRTD